MNSKFTYSTDFYGINSHELTDCCVHLICLEGEGSLEFGYGIK